MPQDKTGSPTGQQPPANQISVTFLNRFVPSSKERLFLAGSFPGQPRLRVVGYYSDARLAALADNERHHVTAAMYPEGPGGRRDAMATAVWAIVFDDVGKVVPAQEGTVPISKGIEIDEDEFLFRPEPSWRIETSRGCYQYGYHLSPSPTPRVAKRILAALKKDPVLGRGLHSLGQYLRLPSGTNTKPGGEGFRTRLAGLGPSWSVEDFVAGFGLDLDAVTEAEATAAGVGRTEQLPPIAVGKLLALIPNTDLTHYDFWIRVGYASWGATGGSEDGRDLWVEWSARSAKFNVGQDTAKTWDSFSAAKASAATLRRIIEELHGPQSPERMEAESIFALEMFDEVDEDEVEKAAQTAAEAEIKLKFRELLAELAKTQTVPTHHKANGADYDEHWLPKGGGLLDIAGLAGTLPVAPPVIFEPFVRGGLTVIGGAPSIGKSNLVLNQALAVVAGRGDLLRKGVKLQFPGDVVYISNEDDLSVVRRRALAWAQHHGVDLTTLPHKLILVRTSLFRKDSKDEWHAACIEVLERVLAHCRAGADIAMVVVDTLGTSISGADEHHIKDMTPVMALFKDLATALWCSLAFLHHTTKEAWARGSADATLRSIATIRGSGGITGTYTRGATLDCRSQPAGAGAASRLGRQGRSGRVHGQGQ